MNFPFELLSDAEEKACKLFDVIKMKNMYGKKVRGIERSTFADRLHRASCAANGAASRCPATSQEVLEFVKTLK